MEALRSGHAERQLWETIDLDYLPWLDTNMPVEESPGLRGGGGSVGRQADSSTVWEFCESRPPAKRGALTEPLLGKTARTVWSPDPEAHTPALGERDLERGNFRNFQAWRPIITATARLRSQTETFRTTSCSSVIEEGALNQAACVSSAERRRFLHTAFQFSRRMACEIPCRVRSSCDQKKAACTCGSLIDRCAAPMCLEKRHGACQRRRFLTPTRRH